MKRALLASRSIWVWPNPEEVVTRKVDLIVDQRTLEKIPSGPRPNQRPFAPRRTVNLSRTE